MATFPPNFEVSVMLCDSAVGAEGKLYIQGGGWETLTVPQFPVIHPRLGLAICIRVPWTETNKFHNFGIEILSQDGPPLTLGPNPTDPGAPKKIDGQFNLGRPPTVQPGDPQTAAMALNIDRQRFDAPGIYSVVVSVDNEEKCRCPFRVTLPAGISLGTAGR